MRWVAETGSTNSDLMAAAAAGDRSAEVLVADLQTAGRGRLDRSWVAPTGTAFTGSLRCAAAVAPEHLGLVPVATGLAVLDALGLSGVPRGVARLKWPNDVIVAGSGTGGLPDRKLAGILCEAGHGVVVIGIGLNCRRPPEVDGILAERAAWISDLVPTAPGLVDLAVSLVLAVDARLGQLEASPASIVADQTAACDTIGRQVRVELPSGSWTGTAVGVDDHGQLLVRRPGSTLPETVMAGDVVHLKPLR